MNSYSLAAFKEAVGTPFKVQAGEREATLQLDEIEERVIRPDFEQFSLLLSGPLGTFLPQQTYRIRNDRLGEMELFMVPVGQTAEGYRYEAAFSLVR
ncbi:hypothetical protein O9H85_12555 [Paenibacillus filicis]|uniref:DUF6916 domain-containing protein n=1 Tax=Paenibacillus gyeongsangnamensis TaxID=3388067 RepID=A0ABT4Q8U1_9BACL|nr:hypothetical protein [Paenibacillus filicis]MCZ8513239.1 hypothetical protein [Paenibacillus filicis]